MEISELKLHMSSFCDGPRKNGFPLSTLIAKQPLDCSYYLPVLADSNAKLRTGFIAESLY